MGRVIEKTRGGWWMAVRLQAVDGKLGGGLKQSRGKWICLGRVGYREVDGCPFAGGG